MKKHSLYSLVTATLIATSLSIEAQMPATIYTLDQCRSLALKNNAAIKMTANSRKAASETRKAALTKYFPEISAGASAFTANHDMIQYDVFHMFDLGIIKNGKTAGIWAIQPVFAGGQIVNGNKLARVGEQVAEIKQCQAEDNVIVETDGLYWNLATLNATKATLESAIVMLDSLARDVAAAVDAGMVVKNDLLKVELKRSEYRNNLIDLNNGLSLMKMLLAQQMGLGATEAIVTSDSIPMSVPMFPDSLYVNGAMAAERTLDHRLLEKNVEAKSLEHKMEIGGNLPSVGLGAGWFYHDIFDQNHNFGAVMVTVTVPISGWWGGSHNIKKKTLELENARTELVDLSQKLAIEITDKWDNLTGAYRKMELSSRDIEKSKENLRITQAYYEAGMNTITDLLDAQALYVESKSNYIAAYGSFRLSISKYLKATGRLKGTCNE